MSEQIMQQMEGLMEAFKDVKELIHNDKNMNFAFSRHGKVRICDLQDLNINNLKYQVVDNIFVISFHVWYLALLRV